MTAAAISPETAQILGAIRKFILESWCTHDVFSPESECEGAWLSLTRQINNLRELIGANPDAGEEARAYLEIASRDPDGEMLRACLLRLNGIFGEKRGRNPELR